jgi:hypothetical protein
MSQTAEHGTALHPFRVFEADVVRCSRLSPSFLRVTFTGPDLDAFADRGFDQRCKLVLPLPDVGLAHLPVGPDWYVQWRALPENLRNPIRTYTVRAVRQQLREVDVDFVVHDHGGPASRWASTAQPGARAALIGPDARYPGDPGGIDFRPAGRVRAFLLAGDETAVPAISSILARCPPTRAATPCSRSPRQGTCLTWPGRPECGSPGWGATAPRTAAGSFRPCGPSPRTHWRADPRAPTAPSDWTIQTSIPNCCGRFPSRAPRLTPTATPGSPGKPELSRRFAGTW